MPHRARQSINYARVRFLYHQYVRKCRPKSQIRLSVPPPFLDQCRERPAHCRMCRQLNFVRR